MGSQVACGTSPPHACNAVVLLGCFAKKCFNVRNCVSLSIASLDIGMVCVGQDIAFPNWSFSPSFSGESACNIGGSWWPAGRVMGIGGFSICLIPNEIQKAAPSLQYSPHADPPR